VKIRSVNVGTPQALEWRGRTLTSAIVKEPVSSPVRVEALGLDGDTQVDRRVHGGVDKAVYLYPSEHYAVWERELGRALSPGALGENLTSEGILEADLRVGDTVEVGTALLQVAEPRLPCVKLAARYQREDLPRVFKRVGLPGIYFRVLRPGVLGAGDGVRVVSRHPEDWSIARVFRLLTGGEPDPGVEARLAALGPLGSGARDTFRRRTGVTAVIGEAGPEAHEPLARLLREAGLPTDGFPSDTPTVLVARAGGAVVGGVALERWGPAALLRSLVVAPSQRGTGLGSALTQAVLAHARASGARSVSLLTETAERFFPDFGFTPVDRSALPAELDASAEMRGACPDSAVAMTLELRPS
jgi:MOSC domain-containing protein YiiM/N-acetylglutamate synthase-like GNAT family acetyltransferase